MLTIKNEKKKIQMEKGRERGRHNRSNAEKSEESAD